MSKAQRTKGAVFEREVAQTFSAALGTKIQRNIGQARDGGNDIDVGPLIVECKRRKTLGTVEAWLDQAETAAAARLARIDETLYPVVVARADSCEPLMIMRLADFIGLAGEELKRRIAGVPALTAEEFRQQYLRASGL